MSTSRATFDISMVSEFTSTDIYRSLILIVLRIFFNIIPVQEVPGSISAVNINLNNLQHQYSQLLNCREYLKQNETGMLNQCRTYLETTYKALITERASVNVSHHRVNANITFRM